MSKTKFFEYLTKFICSQIFIIKNYKLTFYHLTNNLTIDPFLKQFIIG